MRLFFAFFNYFLALLLAPLLPAIINRIKALFAGRVGPPLLQVYYDLFKLLNKGVVYSTTTTWVVRAGPIVGLGSLLGALVLLPVGNAMPLWSFPGDIFLFAYLLGVQRFFLVLAAWDTGSSFEGMGASREMWFSTLAEPALIVALVAVARLAQAFSFSAMSVRIPHWGISLPVLVLVIVALFLVYLAENARIPVDDPQTHLELTMIHEVMVLDHSGPDFAFLQYTAALKLWTLGLLLINLLVPQLVGASLINTLTVLLLMVFLMVVVGVVESIMARLRLVRVPQLLMTASAFSILAMMLAAR